MVAIFSRNAFQETEQTYFPMCQTIPLRFRSYNKRGNVLFTFFSFLSPASPSVFVGTKMFFRVATECQNHSILSVLATVSRPSSSFYPLMWHMRWIARQLQRGGERLRVWHYKIKQKMQEQREECQMMLLNLASACLCGQKATPKQPEGMQNGGGHWVVNKQSWKCNSHMIE